MRHRGQRSPVGRPADRLGGSTREAILEAALATFTEHTYGGTSMALVAERAGVAVGSIYRHFPSKEALGNAVYLGWKRDVLERVTREVDPAASVRTAFGQLWRAFATFAMERPDAFAFLEYQQHEEYLDEDSRTVAGQITTMAADLLVRGQRAREVRAGDPAVLIALAYGAFVGLARTVRLGSPEAAQVFAAAETTVWDMLRTP